MSTSPAPPTTFGAVLTVSPTLTGLPSETLLDIFLLLAYDDLRQLRQVSRTLRAFFDHPALLRATFREGPRSSDIYTEPATVALRRDDRVAIHPVLANQVRWLGLGISGRTIISCDLTSQREPMPLDALQSRDEWATQPAATSIEIEIRCHQGGRPFGGTFAIDHSTGVRLGCVLNHVAQTLVPQAAQISRHPSCGVWMGPATRRPKYTVAGVGPLASGLEVCLQMAPPWFTTFDTVRPALFIVRSHGSGRYLTPPISARRVGPRARGQRPIILALRMRSCQQSGQLAIVR